MHAPRRFTTAQRRRRILRDARRARYARGVQDSTWDCPRLSLSTVDGAPAVGPGRVVLDATGSLSLQVTLRGRGHLHLSDFVDNQDVSGDGPDGKTVAAPGCWVSRVRWNSSTNDCEVTLTPMECVLTDASVSGAWTSREYYLKALHCLGVVRATDGNRSIIVQQLPGLDPDVRRSGLIRAKAVVEDPASVGADVVSIRRELLSVLSLAQRCAISAPREEMFVGDQVAEIILRGSESIVESTHPLIPPTPSELGAFLTQALPAFRAHAVGYELERLLWYYCRAFTEPYAEAKFIFASVFMEALKFAWAKNVAHLPTDQKANGLVRGFIKGMNQKNKPILYTFEELVDQVAAHLNYTTTFTFIEDRNALFHTGAAAANQQAAGSIWAALKPELWKLYAQMDDLILTLLGYTGPIHPYDPAATRVNFPGRTPTP